MPSLAPTVTYLIVGFTILVYVLQLLSVAIFGRFARQAIGNAVFIIAINLFIGLSPGIDNWGHVGGLLGGAIFAWFAGPRWKVIGVPPDVKLEDERGFQETVTGAALVIIIFSALAVRGFTS